VRDRNKPCECGSGVKRKRCLCHVVNEAHEVALWWDQEFERKKYVREVLKKDPEAHGRLQTWEILAVSQMLMR
jgi:hypothetical protein